MQTATVTVGPSEEPVDLTTAKTYIRINHPDEDGMIQRLIVGLRKYLEESTGRRFIQQTVVVELDEWPCDRYVNLEKFGPGDVTEVVSVDYFDVNGDSQTIDPDDYQTDLRDNPPYICPAPGGVWPVVEFDRVKPISITVKAGAASALTCDPRAFNAICMALAYLSENRGGEVGETSVAKGLPAGALRVMDSLWTGAYS